MNRFALRRFTKGLSSGLSILAIFAVGYSLNGKLASALASDDPSTPNTKSYQADFKNLPEAPDEITSKQILKDSDPHPTNQAPNTALAIDLSKGVASEAVDEGDKSDLQDFQATAYCIKGRTASGEYVRPGVIAADPRVLPLGTVVHIRAGKYTGTYKVLDTGGKIKGRKVDIYVPAYREAISFGRRPIKLKVIGGAKRRLDPARKNAKAAGK